MARRNVLFSLVAESISCEKNIMAVKCFFSFWAAMNFVCRHVQGYRLKDCY